jgi:pimeloyl-ACP methyl ester carboxylesterase
VGVLDFLDNWDRALLGLTQAPVRSTPDDLRPYLDAEPRALHPPVVPSRLRWKVTTEGDAAVERFRYASPLPSGEPRNDMVTGRRWRVPEARQSGTALVLLHTAFAPNHQPAWLYARASVGRHAHVYAVPLPYHMGRQPRGSLHSGQFFFSGDVPRMVHGFLQATADTRTLLLSLRHALGYRQVLLAGIGFGGTVAALAAARLDVDGLFLIAPVVDPFVAVWRSPIGEITKRSARAYGFDDDDVRRALHCATPLHFGPPRVERDAIFVTYGTEDLLVPHDALIPLLASWGSPPADPIAMGHSMIVTRANALQQRLGDWVAERRARLPPVRSRLRW